MDWAGITISLFSLVVAGISLGWNIYRDCIERGRLKVTAYVADVLLPGRGPQPKVITVRVTNIGKKPIVLDGHGFLLKNGTQLMPVDSYADFHNRRLEPGDYINVTLANALIQNLLQNLDQLYGFFVIDSCSKKWWLNDKRIVDLINSLVQIKQKQNNLKSPI